MNLAKSTRIGLAIINENSAWLAGMLGVSKNFTSLICRGERVPNLVMIQKIVDALNSHPDLSELTVSKFIEWGESDERFK